MDLGGVGSIGLFMQCVLPYILFNPPGESDAQGPLYLTVRGGTNVSNSPSIEYLTQVSFDGER